MRHGRLGQLLGTAHGRADGAGALATLRAPDLVRHNLLPDVARVPNHDTTVRQTARYDVRSFGVERERVHVHGSLQHVLGVDRIGEVPHEHGTGPGLAASLHPLLERVRLDARHRERQLIARLPVHARRFPPLAVGEGREGHGLLNFLRPAILRRFVLVVKLAQQFELVLVVIEHRVLQQHVLHVILDAQKERGELTSVDHVRLGLLRVHQPRLRLRDHGLGGTRRGLYLHLANRGYSLNPGVQVGHDLKLELLLLGPYLAPARVEQVEGVGVAKVARPAKLRVGPRQRDHHGGFLVRFDRHGVDLSLRRPVGDPRADGLGTRSRPRWLLVALSLGGCLRGGGFSGCCFHRDRLMGLKLEPVRRFLGARQLEVGAVAVGIVGVVPQEDRVVVRGLDRGPGGLEAGQRAPELDVPGDELLGDRLHWQLRAHVLQPRDLSGFICVGEGRNASASGFGEVRAGRRCRARG